VQARIGPICVRCVDVWAVCVCDVWIQDSFSTPTKHASLFICFSVTTGEKPNLYVSILTGYIRSWM